MKHSKEKMEVEGWLNSEDGDSFLEIAESVENEHMEVEQPGVEGRNFCENSSCKSKQKDLDDKAAKELKNKDDEKLTDQCRLLAANPRSIEEKGFNSGQVHQASFLKECDLPVKEGVLVKTIPKSDVSVCYKGKEVMRDTGEKVNFMECEAETEKCGAKENHPKTYPGSTGEGLKCKTASPGEGDVLNVAFPNAKAYVNFSGEEGIPTYSSGSKIHGYYSSSSDDDDSFADEEGWDNRTASKQARAPFDVNLLKKTIEDSAESVRLIDGRDVVMLVGKTGSGKSTLMQAIAGKKLIEATYSTTYRGKNVVHHVYEAVNGLAEFEIGHTKTSMTRSFHALTLSDSVYLDTPGLEDTSGYEMDIATSSVMNQIAKNCKSLRLVILINCASLLEDRGGAFRSVLKFVNKFVRDFNSSKRSFMFLFTHIELLSGSKPIEDATQCLLDEIVRISKSKNCDDIATVLNFVRKSLRKGFANAGIFHPLQMKFPIDEIEPAKSEALTSNCNLTPPAKLVLDSAVDHLLHKLNAALKATPPDMSEVNEIKSTLSILHAYIDVNQVRNALFKAESLVEEHTKGLKCLIRELERQGTNSEVDFTNDDVLKLKSSIESIKKLDSEFSLQHWVQNIGAELDELKADILRNASALEPFSQDLNKLAVWAQGFKELGSKYSSTIKELAMHLESATACIQSADISRLNHSNKEDALHFFKCITSSHFLCKELACFSEFEQSIDQAQSTLTSVLEMLESMCETWVQHASTFSAKQVEVGFEAEVEVLVSYERLLEWGQLGLKDETTDFRSLSETMAQSSSELKDSVTIFLVKCCSNLKQSTFHPNWEHCMKSIQSSHNSIMSLQGERWEDTFRPIAALVDEVKSRLLSLSGEIESSLKIANEFGFVSCSRVLAENCDFFHGWQWFDSFLPPESAFVSNFCIRISSSVKEEASRLCRESDHFLSLLSNKSEKSSEAIKGLVKLLPELKAISDLVSVLDNCSGDPQDTGNLHVKYLSHLESYFQSMDKTASNLVQDWADNMVNDWAGVISTSLPQMNSIIEDTEAALTNMDSTGISTLPRDIQFKISNMFLNFEKCLKQELSSFNGDFAKKKCLLSSYKACKGFAQIENCLEGFEIMQRILRDSVFTESKRIEEMIEDASNLNEVELCLEKFRSAVVLDDFVGNEISASLSALVHLREQKERQDEKLMALMIKNHDFKGIVDSLSKFSNTKDAMNKQLFDHYLNMIRDAARAKANVAHRCLNVASIQEKDMKSLQKNLNFLRTAQSQIQVFMKEKVDLDDEIEKLISRVTSKMAHYSELFADAITEKNFSKLVFLKNYATLLFSHTSGYCSSETKEMFDRLLSKYDNLIESVTKGLDDYFNSCFKNTSGFLESLSGLKKIESKRGALFEDLVRLYSNCRNEIEQRSKELMTQIEQIVSETQCYDDALHHLHSLNRQLQGLLKPHCSQDLLVQCERFTEKIQMKQKDHARSLEFGSEDPQRAIERYSQHLDRLLSTPLRHLPWSSTRKTYENSCNRISAIVNKRYQQARAALKAKDFIQFEDCLEILVLFKENTSKHVKETASLVSRLKSICKKHFLECCSQAKEILKKNRTDEFEVIFNDYRGLVAHSSFVLDSPEASSSFSEVNWLVYDSFQKGITALETLLLSETPQFSRIRSRILSERSVGNFIADYFPLLREELKCLEPSRSDEWLEKINDLCWEHFKDGRDLSKINHCLVLGVVPSASEDAIKKAYRAKAKISHPDKNGQRVGGDSGATFRKIKEAYDEMLNAKHLSDQGSAQAFDSKLRDLGQHLRSVTKSLAEDQRYREVRRLLFVLPHMRVLEDLVVPKFDCEQVQAEIYSLIKNHVEKSRVEVESFWAERKYRDLNDSLSNLKSMEDHFKTYPQIYSASWTAGVFKDIENEIEALGCKAMSYLSSLSSAREQQNEFRRSFMSLGHVLVELPSFRIIARSVMTSWGYGFLFEFGVSLQKGECFDDDEEIRVARSLLSEFPQFKEVTTFVWNQETSQKPAEDTVMHIKAFDSSSNPLLMDLEQLIKDFRVFDGEYKLLLAEYIKPNADLELLVRHTKDLANTAKPSGCCRNWTSDVKKQIPLILAGIFALFTVLKSGASYNRIEEASSSSSDSALCEQILMTPHNIQVLTLLSMIGCGNPSSSSLENHLVQIRTGEGKSIILGAASALFGLLGFRVRTVCYSEYLSGRDFNLFEEVFSNLGILDDIKYSTIVSYAEEQMATKGDIREMTESLLRGKPSKIAPNSTAVTLNNERSMSVNLGPQKSVSSVVESAVTPSNETSFVHRMKETFTSFGRVILKHSEAIEVNSHCAKHESSLVKKTTRCRTSTDSPSSAIVSSLASAAASKVNDSEDQLDLKNPEEILLVDEIDVFFSSEFYGQTYDQVVEFREPEVVEILRLIWNAYQQGGRILKLKDLKSTAEYRLLSEKMKSFGFILDTEILMMLDQVRRVSDYPYYVDADNDRIGYKVMDTISYDVTYGYTTMFAYLKEARKWKRKDTISSKLVMPISCAQFSYANISPTRILGVSGTLEAMGQFEKEVLAKYNLNKFIYVPSVYGTSNFEFDKAGKGIYFEDGISGFFHRLTEEISNAVKMKRSVIVFFQNRRKLDKFVSSSFFPQLGRHKNLLTEDMDANDKEFVISSAATSGQITLCTAVFGRGTDFFCKDDTVQNSGGVHVIQTFLSEEVSEEIQIQGRTARQGKPGSYQLILFDTDLETEFGVRPGERERVPKDDLYDWLGVIRQRHLKKRCDSVNANLSKANEGDIATNSYFDALLAGDEELSKQRFRSLYEFIKSTPTPSIVDIDLALLIDVTGSMKPFCQCVTSTVRSFLCGSNSLLSKLESKSPDTTFNLNVACLAFRDFDDTNQFEDSIWIHGGHFTSSMDDAAGFVENVLLNPSGGSDLAEDHIGALVHCVKSWNHKNDWTSDIKFALLFSDAPCHGHVPPSLSSMPMADNHPNFHPRGISTASAVDCLLSKGIHLFFCSFNPNATSQFEKELSNISLNHQDNLHQIEIKRIPMLSKNEMLSQSLGGCGKHIIFVLDESTSMSQDWAGVVEAYKKYVQKRQESQHLSDLVSVVQFSSRSRVTVSMENITSSPMYLAYSPVRGTKFHPASKDAVKLAYETPQSHSPAVIFMSDGCSLDFSSAAKEFSKLNRFVRQKSGNDFELHVIAFRSGTQKLQLREIANASGLGKVYPSANIVDLENIFVTIALNQNVTSALESEVGRRISDAVSERISLEYFRT